MSQRKTRKYPLSETPANGRPCLILEYHWIPKGYHLDLDDYFRERSEGGKISGRPNGEVQEEVR